MGAVSGAIQTDLMMWLSLQPTGHFLTLASVTERPSSCRWKWAGNTQAQRAKDKFGDNPEKHIAELWGEEVPQASQLWAAILLQAQHNLCSCVRCKVHPAVHEGPSALLVSVAACYCAQRSSTPKYWILTLVATATWHLRLFDSLFLPLQEGEWMLSWGGETFCWTASEIP